MAIERTMRRIDPTDEPTEYPFKQTVSLGFLNSQDANRLVFRIHAYMHTFCKAYGASCDLWQESEDGIWHITIKLAGTDHIIMHIKPMRTDGFSERERYWKFQITSADRTAIFVRGFGQFADHDASIRSVIMDLAPRLRRYLLSVLT